MATFTQWLAEQETRSDQAGYIAQWYKSYEGNRPRMSSPVSVQRWLEKSDPQRWAEGGKEAWQVMLDEYRGHKADSHLQIVRETPDQAIVTLGAINQHLQQVNLKLDLIAAHLGLGVFEDSAGNPVSGVGSLAGHWPAPQAVPDPPAITAPPSWQEMAARADFTEEAGA